MHHLQLGINRLKNLLATQQAVKRSLFNAAMQARTADQRLATRTMDEACTLTINEISAALADLEQQVLIDKYNAK